MDVVHSGIKFEHDEGRPLSVHLELHEAEAFAGGHRTKVVDVEVEAGREVGLIYRGVIDQLFALVVVAAVLRRHRRN